MYLLLSSDKLMKQGIRQATLRLWMDKLQTVRQSPLLSSKCSCGTMRIAQRNCAWGLRRRRNWIISDQLSRKMKSPNSHDGLALARNFSWRKCRRMPGCRRKRRVRWACIWASIRRRQGGIRVLSEEDQCFKRLITRLSVTKHLYLLALKEEKDLLKYLNCSKTLRLYTTKLPWTALRVRLRLLQQCY